MSSVRHFRVWGHPNGSYVAIGTSDGQACFVVATPTAEHCYRERWTAEPPTWSRDGRWVAIRTSVESVLVASAGSAETVARLPVSTSRGVDWDVDELVCCSHREAGAIWSTWTPADSPAWTEQPNGWSRLPAVDRLTFLAGPYPMAVGVTGDGDVVWAAKDGAAGWHKLSLPADRMAWRLQPHPERRACLVWLVNRPEDQTPGLFVVPPPERLGGRLVLVTPEPEGLRATTVHEGLFWGSAWLHDDVFALLPTRGRLELHTPGAGRYYERELPGLAGVAPTGVPGTLLGIVGEQLVRLDCPA